MILAVEKRQALLWSCFKALHGTPLPLGMRVDIQGFSISNPLSLNYTRTYIAIHYEKLVSV